VLVRPHQMVGVVMLYEEKYHKHLRPEESELVTHARTIRLDQVVGISASY
jgi:hypothetical protein